MAQAAVSIIRNRDSVLHTTVRGNADGYFELRDMRPGKYLLMIMYPGRADHMTELDVSDTSHIDLGMVTMIPAATLLREVIVKAGWAMRMRGDTLEFTADSFAVRQGANVEELLKRLPGIYVERDGKITAQGKEVRRIFVDGDEFFSDDPKVASKYLKAGAVDKVQVYDAKSEASQFTGIEDGVRIKTINLQLKANRRSGILGKLSAGSNGEEMYRLEAMNALFRDRLKVSVFGMASYNTPDGQVLGDLTNYIEYNAYRVDDGGIGINYSNNNFEGEALGRGGIPAVRAVGGQFTNKWKEDKEMLTANYRLRHSTAAGWAWSNNTTMLPDGVAQSVRSDKNSSGQGFLQKASGRYEVPLDTFATLGLVLNGMQKRGQGVQETTSETGNSKGFLINSSILHAENLYNGDAFDSHLSLRRRFRKEGRTFSAFVQQQYNNIGSSTHNQNFNKYFDPQGGMFVQADSLDHQQQSTDITRSYIAGFTYTDKLSDRLRLSVDYTWGTSGIDNDFIVYNRPQEVDKQKIDSLSNDYSFVISSNAAGGALSWTKAKWSITGGSKAVFFRYRQRDNDLKATTGRRFTNIIPHFQLRYGTGQDVSLSLEYEGGTVQPSISQLQPLRRSSNQLFTTIGNPTLVPAFRHSGRLQYSSNKWERQQYMHAMLSADYTSREISRETYIDANGRTTERSVNLNGRVNYSANLGYGRAIGKTGLRVGVNVGGGHYANYMLLNGTRFMNNTNRFNAGTNIYYLVSEKATIRSVSNVNYHVSRTTVSRDRIASWSHSHQLELTVNLPWEIYITSDCRLEFRPANTAFNTNWNNFIWNAAMVKRFLKDRSAEISFSATDILNSNMGYYRYASGNSFSEGEQLVLRRYFLLSFSWNFSKSISTAGQ